MLNPKLADPSLAKVIGCAWGLRVFWTKTRYQHSLLQHVRTYLFLAHVDDSAHVLLVLESALVPKHDTDHINCLRVPRLHIQRLKRNSVVALCT